MVEMSMNTMDSNTRSSILHSNPPFDCHRGFESVPSIQQKGPASGPFSIAACRTWHQSTALMGERPESPRFLVAMAHYAPRNREDSFSLSHHARYDRPSPTGRKMAEREGLLGLRPRPSGRRRFAPALSRPLRGLGSNPPFDLHRGFESVPSIQRKGPASGPFSLDGGERGIRTLDGAFDPILP